MSRPADHRGDGDRNGDRDREEVRDPRTGLVERGLAPPDDAELAAVAARLRAHQPAWEAAGVEHRIAVLTAWQREVAVADDLLAALVRDTGRAVESAMEHRQVVSMIDRCAAVARDVLAGSAVERASSSVPSVSIGQTLRAYPLVGVISPWNFPLLLGLIDTIPALLAGAAVLVKPSEVTPRFVEPLMRTVERVPELAGVLRVVEGSGATGAAMVGLVDAVSFTGSVPTGRRVAAAAAAAFIPAFLELGGKDPAVVLASADLDRAAAAILWGGTANAGQSCLSIERVYVAAERHDEFVDRLVERAGRLALARPGLDDGAVGPLIDPAQARVIDRHLRDAQERGAVARCGGAVIHDGGWWCPPTVLTGVDHGMLVMREETFGPVLPVMPFDDVDEAVRLANDTHYGLSAAVFAGTAEEALAVARRLDAGAVSINDAALTALVHDGEKNSFKSSGLGGSRMGTSGVRRFLRQQALLVNRSPEPDPWWYGD